MAQSNAICRIHMKEDDDNSMDNFADNSLSNKLNMVEHDVRLAWSRAILNMYRTEVNDTNTQEPRSSIRDWDIELSRDGTLRNLVTSSTEKPEQESLNGDQKVYAAQYRIPNSKLARFESQGEKISRRELFAVGSMVYEIHTSHKPFHDLDLDLGSLHGIDGERRDREIESRFAKGNVPEDIWTLPVGIACQILCCWCPELIVVLKRLSKGTLGSRIKKEIMNHPGRVSLQVLGGVASVASIAAIPVLGAVGFTAVGPAAGSAAAAWQAGLGLVRAGSLFAWCQSAAMGGAAVGGIVATGVSGGSLLLGSTAWQWMSGQEFDKLEVSASELKELFLATWHAAAD